VIVQKTRRGLNKSIESQQKSGEKSSRAFSSPPASPPSSEATPPSETESTKIVFQPVRMRNNRRQYKQEVITPEHREIVTFVTSGWLSVKQEIDQGSAKVKYYQEAENPRLSEFEPFDLDAWWGKKLYLSLTKDV